MCIYCNMAPTVEAKDPADNFLTAFEGAQTLMKKACDAMLVCSKVAITPEARKQYNHTHKRMVRLKRDWNRIEQMREAKPE